MPNPQIQQVVDSLWWKVAPWILVCGAIGTFGGLAVKWLERRAIRFGQDWRRRRAEREETGRRSQTAATGSETPRCPSCNAVMVKRTAKRGARSGLKFWGCSRWPECRGTREA